MAGITRKARVLQTHIKIAPVGTEYTTPESGTVTDTVLPADTNDAWVDLGIVSECKEKKASKTEEVWGAEWGSGVAVLQDIIEHQLDKTFTAKLGKLGAEEMGIINNAGILKNGTSTTYTPNSTTTPYTWIWVEQYDQGNNLVNTIKALSFVTIDGDMSTGGGISNGSLSFRLLSRAENTGTLGPIS